MESYLLIIVSTIAVATATTPTPVTKSTRPPITPCPNSLCNNRLDGNDFLILGAQLRTDAFLSCVNGMAYCRYCPDQNGPQLQYSRECDQCLSPADVAARNCFTTQPTGTPLPPPNCPTNQTLNDAQCAELGADFCGNRADYRIPADPQVFLMCYNGKYVDCMECQHELQFIELTNFKNEYDIYGHCA